MKSRVKRQERQREIKRFEILEKDEQDILFRTEVEGGTYIRKLVDDLGRYLGIGAHMLELRRIRAGIFKEDSVVNLYDFEKAVREYESGNEEALRKMIIPGEVVSEVYGEVQVKENVVDRLLHGKVIHYDDLKKEVKKETGKIISVFSNNNFIGMFKVINGERVFAKPEFVLQPIKNA